MKKRYLLWAFLALLGPLLITELVLQLIVRIPQTPFAVKDPVAVSIQEKAMESFVQDRIRQLWSRPFSEKATPFQPPFTVFVNRGLDDENRMHEISVQAKFPAFTQTKQQNFLRLNKTPDTGVYTVTINKYGFRGPNYPAKKSKDTYRIMTLGSYPAFGHAVNDNETYSAYLEKLLNTKFKGKKHFEVWNWGRQGGSAIMGAALLKFDIDQYQPDMIIWDFGWIEMYTSSDLSSSDKISSMLLRNRGDFEKKVVSFCANRLWLATCEQAIKKITKIGTSEVEKSWGDVMVFLKSWSEKRHLPVIFMRHIGVSLDEEMYKKFDDPQNSFFYLPTDTSISEPPSKAESTDFWKQENWLSELGYNREQIEQMHQEFLLFHSDAIQYNAIAYKRFAQWIEKFMLEHSQAFSLPTINPASK